jgi:F-type H+-transporting ATPase subunit b
MSLLATATVLAGRVLQGAEEEEHHVPFDDKGYTTENPILPPFTEMLISAAASIIVFVLLYKFAWPLIKKSMNDRTAGIQKQLEDSASAKVAAETEAVRIREAQGDIEAERARLHAEAEAQATALLIDGRARLDVEMAELEARAETDIAAAAGRSSDELRAEIARHSSVAIDRIVDETLDDATHQALIEGFIQRVGATTGASA